jgi:hypothetical protein
MNPETVIQIPIDNDHFLITLYPDGPAGSIASTFHSVDVDDNTEYNATVDAIESLILAHACAGVNVQDPAYIKGLKTTMRTISERL